MEWGGQDQNHKKSYNHKLNTGYFYSFLDVHLLKKKPGEHFYTDFFMKWKQETMSSSSLNNIKIEPKYSISPQVTFYVTL